jgi:hypothetical protein
MGKINAQTTISFNQSAGTTTPTDSRLGVNSLVALMPITANAALPDQASEFPARPTTLCNSSRKHSDG